MKYQTFVYEMERKNWEVIKVLFKSAILDNPTDAMEAVNNFVLPQTDWLMTMKTQENGKILEEQSIDSSMVKFD